MAVRELGSPPGMLPMFARAGMAMIPGASRVPFLAGGGRKIPDLTLVLDEIETDRERLARYQRVCGFDIGDQLPPTFPHMLAFPLQLALMTDKSFPFAAIGLVHIGNRILAHRSVQAGERLSLRVWATELEPHPHGQQFSLRSEARVEDELVWEEVSTNLRRGGGSGESAESGTTAGSGGEGGLPAAQSLTAAATWKLPGDLGRRYASVSGDFNPIHWNERTAREVGLPGVIAHGMLTMALASRLVTAWAGDPGAVVECAVRFTRPVVVPDNAEGALVELSGTVAQRRDDGTVVVAITACCAARTVLGLALIHN